MEMREAAREEITGKQRRENERKRVEVHITKEWGCVFYEISLEDAIIIIGK